MKKQSQTTFNEMGKATENQVNGKAIGNGQQKTFYAIDMWNIHRQKKAITIR